MTTLKVGDLVRLRDGAGWKGTVLDVVDSRPRWLLVYWHTPPALCGNPLLENEEFLASVDQWRTERAARAA